MLEVKKIEGIPSNRIFEVLIKQSNEEIYISKFSNDKIQHFLMDYNVDLVDFRDTIKIHNSNNHLKRYKTNANIHKISLISSEIYSSIIYSNKSNILILSKSNTKRLSLKSLQKIIKYNESILEDEKVIINIEKYTNSPGYISNLNFRTINNGASVVDWTSNGAAAGSSSRINDGINRGLFKESYSNAEESKELNLTKQRRWFYRESFRRTIVKKSSSNLFKNSFINDKYDSNYYDTLSNPNLHKIKNIHSVFINKEKIDFACLNRPFIIIYEMLGISVTENSDCIFYSSYIDKSDNINKKNRLLKQNKENTQNKFLRFNSKLIDENELKLESEIKKAFKKLNNINNNNNNNSNNSDNLRVNRVEVVYVENEIVNINDSNDSNMLKLDPSKTLILTPSRRKLYQNNPIKSIQLNQCNQFKELNSNKLHNLARIFSMLNISKCLSAIKFIKTYKDLNGYTNSKKNKSINNIKHLNIDYIKVTNETINNTKDDLVLNTSNSSNLSCNNNYNIYNNSTQRNSGRKETDYLENDSDINNDTNINTNNNNLIGIKDSKEIKLQNTSSKTIEGDISMDYTDIGILIVITIIDIIKYFI